MRALLLLPFLLAPPALAQVEAIPACNAVREGALACMAGRACRCHFERGGSVAGRPDGYRWDCGALRPDCGVPPADLTPGERPPTVIMPSVPLGMPGWRDPP
ncbi:hypothetical protein [Muricoccus radiodurans]|uniref:hypothetical protein n=1 Tax=Muricoccus radiodurans TaxID=2231721 RepID=UPI003CEE606D